MFITVHSAIGVAATTAIGINDPALAFTVGWSLHYVADAIPHGDERFGSWVMRHRNPNRIMALIFGVDFLLLLLILAVVWLMHGLTLMMVAAVAGSMVPDVLLGFEMAMGRRTLSWLTRFHVLAHKLTGFIYSLKYGLPLQVTLVVIMWCLIF